MVSSHPPAGPSPAGLPEPGHRAQNFFELAMGMVDTYDQAIKEVIGNHQTVSVEEREKIFRILASYLPQFRTVFDNICTNCPSFLMVQEVLAQVQTTENLEASQLMREVAAFIAGLIHQDSRLKDQVLLMSLSDLSTEYARASAVARVHFDRRLRLLLADRLDPEDRQLYLGAGIFLFCLAATAKDGTRSSRRRILSIVRSLLAGGEGQPAEPPAEDGAAAIEPAFRPDGALVQRLAELAAAPPQTDPRDRRPEGHLTRRRRAFATETRDVQYLFDPIWDASLKAVAGALLVPARRIGGALLIGDEVLSRVTHDSFLYDFQIAKLDAAVSALVHGVVEAGGDAQCPTLMTPLSLNGLARVPLAEFAQDLGNLLLGCRSRRLLAVILTDADEQLPLKHIKGIVEEFDRHGIVVHWQVGFGHPAAALIAKAEGSAFVLNLESVLQLGMDTDLSGRIVLEFARLAHARGGAVLLTNVHSSLFVQVAQRGAIRWISGKVAGHRHHLPPAWRELPVSALLHKV